MRRLADKDFLTALVLFGISAIFSVGSSSDPKDWAFPLLANYVLLTIAIILLARAIFSAFLKREPDTVEFSSDDRLSFADVLVFLVIVLAFMFVMFGLGFWPSSLFMLVLTSVYLTAERTRRNMVMAIIVPIGICIAAFIIFTHLFYVPFPGAGWFEAG